MRRTSIGTYKKTEAKNVLFFVSLFLEILLVSLFSGPAVSAAAGTEAYSVTVQIPVTYTAENTQETLTCKLEYEEDAAQSVEDDTLTLEDGEKGFFKLTYTEPGTYHCKVSQVKGDSAGVTYDETVFSVDIYITDDGLGNLLAEAVVVYTEDSDKLPSVDFTNRGESDETPTPRAVTPTPYPSAVTPTPSAVTPTPYPSSVTPTPSAVTPTPYPSETVPSPTSPEVTPEIPEATPTSFPIITPREDYYTEPSVSVTPGVTTFVTSEFFITDDMSVSVTPDAYVTGVSVTSAPEDRTDETSPVKTADETPSAERYTVLLLAALGVLSVTLLRKRRM